MTRISTDGNRFRDLHGRHLILRGVNLGGDCKVPSGPDGHSWRPTDFADHRTISFVGRPAPLEELDGHLARIAGWGFNCLRLLTTWEAVEHAGPGEHDEAYLDYLTEVCRRAGAHGLLLFIDFHQDVWSRMSGGDGAPGWTWEAAGLDFTRFGPADAAHVMQYAYDPQIGGRQAAYPTMSWGRNYRMPANGLMWTLFLAGQELAPGCKVCGTNIQTYLQDHYLGAMRAVAERVADMDHVIGFDTLNEPGTGWIGQGLEERRSLFPGPAWTPLDGLAAASGLTRKLPVHALGGGEAGSIRVNEAGLSVWREGRADPFREAGVLDVDAAGEPVALLPDHFRRVGARTVDVERDYMVPFFGRVADTIRSIRDDWLVFAEVDPFGAMRGNGFPAGMPERTVNASHWYDLAALVTKRFSTEQMTDVLTGATYEGAEAIRAAYVAGLSRIRAIGDQLPGGAPTLIGECGIPFDMNEAEAYARWAAGERDPSLWHAQAAALSLMYDALDQLLLSSTQWNYTVSNRNDPMIGDGWNQEDLSIWSADQSTDEADPDSGGRAVAGFSRPFVRAAQGDLLRQQWDWQSGVFECEIDADPDLAMPTEIYLPGGGADFSGGEQEGLTRDGSFVHHRAGERKQVRIRLTRGSSDSQDSSF